MASFMVLVIDCCSYIALWHLCAFLFGIISNIGKPHYFSRVVRGPADFLNAVNGRSLLVLVLRLVLQIAHRVFFIVGLICLVFGIRVLPHTPEQCSLFEYEPMSIIIWAFSLYLGFFCYLPHKDYTNSYSSNRVISPSSGVSFFHPVGTKMRGAENLSLLRNSIKGILKNIEATDLYPSTPSAIDDVLSSYDTYMSDKIKKASLWDDDFDFDSYANYMITEICFNLLKSGQYGLSDDIIDPSNKGCWLLAYLKTCLDWGVAHGRLDAGAKEGVLQALASSIHAEID